MSPPDGPVLSHETLAELGVPVGHVVYAFRLGERGFAVAADGDAVESSLLGRFIVGCGG